MERCRTCSGKVLKNKSVAYFFPLGLFETSTRTVLSMDFNPTMHSSSGAMEMGLALSCVGALREECQ